MSRINTKTENAVSPVVGVMLMLVVTIIIAAMVAAFSGGVINTETKAPQSTVTADYIANFADDDKTDETYGSNPATNNGLKFRISGGDSFSLKDITIQLKSGTDAITLTQDSVLNKTSLAKTISGDGEKISIIKNSRGNETYLARIGVNTDPVVTIGDSFMVLADWAYDSTLSSSEDKGRFLVWWPEGKTEGFSVKTNVPIEYTILDQLSGKPIQSGTITIR